MLCINLLAIIKHTRRILVFIIHHLLIKLTIRYLWKSKIREWKILKNILKYFLPLWFFTRHQQLDGWVVESSWFQQLFFKSLPWSKILFCCEEFLWSPQHRVQVHEAGVLWLPWICNQFLWRENWGTALYTASIIWHSSTWTQTLRAQKHKPRKTWSSSCILYAVKSHGEVELQLRSFLTSALDVVNCQPHTSPFLPPEKALLIPVI